MSTPIIISASDLAACIGLNQYKPPAEMLSRYLAKMSVPCYIAYAQATGNKRKEDMILEVRAKLANKDSKHLNVVTNNAVTTAVAPSNTTTYKKGVAEAIDNVNDKVDGMTNLTLEEKALLKDDLQRKVYTNIGTRTESRVVDNLGGNTKLDKTYATKLLGKAYAPNGQEFDVMIKGQIDAFQEDEDGNRIVVEVKNRMNNLFRRVVAYEFVQIMSYMYIFDCAGAKLVENFQGEIMEHYVPFDVDEWNMFTREAIAFAQQLLQIAHKHDNGDLFPEKEESEDEHDDESV